MKTVLLFLLLTPAFVWAQFIKISPEDTQRKHSYLILRDGSVVRGQILRQDSTIITVRKRDGEMSFIEADLITRISVENPGHTDEKIVTNPEASSTIFVLKDGTRLAGTFVRRDSTMITVRKLNGQNTFFEPELLVRVDTVRDAADITGLTTSGKPAFANRFSPFLLANTTAFNPEKGQVYYRNTLVLLNEFDYGITQNWSIGASANPFFGHIETINSARETVLGANVRFFSKLTFPIGDQFRFGINAIYQPKQKVNLFSIRQQVVLQGLMSFGDSQRNATLSYGVLIYPDYTGANKTSFISAGVMHKISRNLTILSDNTFYLNPYFAGTSASLSIALRFDRRRHAFDLGAFSAVQPTYYYYSGYLTTPPGTRAYFYPYIAYNLLISRH